LRKELEFRAAITSPSALRQRLRIDPEFEDSFEQLLETFQRKDFEALDRSWTALARLEKNNKTRACQEAPYEQQTNNFQSESLEQSPQTLPDGRGSFSKPYHRIYLERPRGHSKTTDLAVQIAWILIASHRALSGIAAAADMDQAALVSAAVQRIARGNPELFRDLIFQKNLIRNKKTGSKLEIISSDVQSSWGIIPDFIICDELCHWEQPEMWESLLSSAAKKKDCLLVVLTNAGVGRDWQWKVREAARESQRWYFSTLDGPQAPWITDDWLEEQKEMLPKPVFERLWLNRWQHSDGEFVTLAEAEACRDDSLAWTAGGEQNVTYFAAVDYAEKHDYTVGVVVHRDGENIVVDRMDAISPTPDSPVPVSWVERWIENVGSNFPHVRFVLDEYQLVGVIQKYESHFEIDRFAFAGGRGNHQLAIHLRRLILNRKISWYADCGAVDSILLRDDLETELASLKLKVSASGRCRIDHTRDSIHHDDRAFTLGAACLHALKHSDEIQWMEVSPPGFW